MLIDGLSAEGARDIEPLVFAAPDLKELEEHLIAEHDTGRVVARMEADFIGSAQV